MLYVAVDRLYHFSIGDAESLHFFSVIVQLLTQLSRRYVSLYFTLSSMLSLLAQEQI